MPYLKNELTYWLNLHISSHVEAEDYKRAA